MMGWSWLDHETTWADLIRVWALYWLIRCLIVFASLIYLEWKKQRDKERVQQAIEHTRAQELKRMHERMGASE